jgi:hypothetical protein
MDPMAVARSYHVMASSGGNVYAIGGPARGFFDLDPVLILRRY